MQSMDEQKEGFEVIDSNGALPAENAVKVTSKYMTKYERARILGTRALQIRYASTDDRR